LEEGGSLYSNAAAREQRCRVEDLLRALPDVDRNRRLHCLNETVVVGMRVRDEHTQQRRIAPGETRNRRELQVNPRVRIQRPCYVDNDPLAGFLELNAATPDLACAAMNSCPHRSGRDPAGIDSLHPWHDEAAHPSRRIINVIGHPPGPHKPDPILLDLTQAKRDREVDEFVR
jgi:hypothetical protein